MQYKTILQDVTQQSLRSEIVYLSHKNLCQPCRRTATCFYRAAPGQEVGDFLLLTFMQQDIDRAVVLLSLNNVCDCVSGIFNQPTVQLLYSCHCTDSQTGVLTYTIHQFTLNSWKENYRLSEI